MNTIERNLDEIVKVLHGRIDPILFNRDGCTASVYPKHFYYDLYPLLRHVKDTGDELYIEIMEGARKGSIYKVNLDTTVVRPLKRSTNHNFRVETLKLEINEGVKKTKHFDFLIGGHCVSSHSGRWLFKSQDPDLREKWEFKTKPKSDKSPIFDHFGVELVEGQTVIFISGNVGHMTNAFGKIKKISDNFVITVEQFKTSENGKSGDVRISRTVPSSSLIVVDGDLMDKIVMARLKY